MCFVRKIIFSVCFMYMFWFVKFDEYEYELISINKIIEEFKEEYVRVCMNTERIFLLIE